MGEIRRLYTALYEIRRKLAIGAVGLLAFWMAIHVVSGPNGMLVYQKKRSEYRQLEKQINQLQKENDVLTQRTKALKNDRTTIEREAREQLGYAKPGEVIYVVPGQNAPQDPPANAAAQKPADSN